MKNIKNLRLKAGYTQEQLADLLDVDQTTVSKWETDDSVPGARLLQPLAKTLNCTVNDLYTADEKEEEGA